MCQIRYASTFAVAHERQVRAARCSEELSVLSGAAAEDNDLAFWSEGRSCAEDQDIEDQDIIDHYGSAPGL